MIGTCEWTKEGAKRCTMISTPKIQKFPQDMADYEDDSFRLVCEGYQLGRKGELVPAILQAYGRDPQSLPRLFRGAFAFALYDMQQGRLTVVNDLLSKKPIFYFSSAERLIFSTSFLELADELKAREIPLTPDELGLAMMTRHGVFFDDVTYVREISYLKPYGWLQGTRALETRFLPVPERKPVSGMDALLKEMDARFGRAVRLEYLLNADENYPQYATLSAGMDSKSVFLYAYQQGFQNDVCFTYAQSGSMDMAVPQQIAADYGCKHFFFSLDNGDVIKERERIIPLNEAQMEYCGTTGVQSFLSFMDTSKAGVVHTGLGGGEIMG
ncbi:MAG: hypothetical protein EOM69_07680, partial [Clostridia bacterium]|nr:hypothetical protein [Clostridia bacterium]